MNQFITLRCPSCGGKLEVGEKVSVLRCEHCGIEHLVNRSENLVSLESFARCPKCSRNDRVEKVKAIYEYKTAPQVLLTKIAPPNPTSIKQPDYLDIPELILPEKPILKTIKDKPEPSPLSLIVYMINSVLLLIWLFLGIYFISSGTSLNTFVIILIFLTVLAIYLAITLTKKDKRTFKIENEENLRINEERISRWNESVEEAKQEHYIIIEEIKERNLNLDKYYHLKKNRVIKQLILWEGLYYCYRDDTVFIPGTNKFASVEKMNDFLYNNIE